MNTLSPRVENRRIDGALRSSMRTQAKVVGRATLRAARRVIPDRWVVDLLVLAFAVLLVGAFALGGLAVVSTQLPAPDHAATDRKVCGRHDVEQVTFGVCGSDLMCCQEVP